MPRSAGVRLSVLLALLAQVANAAHLPMVHARSAVSDPAVSAHCADHAHPHVMGNAGAPGTGDGQQLQHSGSCDSGLCVCPCGQAPALAGPLAFPGAASAHPPASPAYRAPEPLQVLVTFFRPPI